MRTLTFSFSTGANPCPANETASALANISVGQAGAAWLPSLWLAGASQGLWDLGPGGRITVSLPQSASMTATVRFYGDSGLYAAGPIITLDGREPNSFSDMKEVSQTTGPNVMWMITRKCLWTRADADSTKSALLVIASPAVMPQDALVDSVVVEYGTSEDSQVSALIDGIKQARDILIKLLA